MTTQSHSTEPASLPGSAPSDVIGVDVLAQILIEQELPLEVDVDIDLTVADLTVVDPTVADPAPAEETGPGNRWSLTDDTDIGGVVTPEHVLAARSRHRQEGGGRQLPGSDGVLHQSTAGFAADYVWNHIIEQPRPNAATRFGAAVGWAEVAGEAQYRLEHFLNLTDDDFLACFRFNGDITGEYLTQVSRCERNRRHDLELRHQPTPTARQRRIAKARSLSET